MPLLYNGKIIPLAKHLRKNMTPQEKRLWYDYLAKYPIRFQRQRVIDNFIADFYCHRARLIIEVDGAHHYTPEGKDYDEVRTQILMKYGLSVLRFSNSDIDSKFDGVCYIIDKTIKERIKS